MIRKEEKNHSLLHLFLTEKERRLLQDLGSELHDWEEGRQGTGYFKLDIREYTTYGTLPWLQAVVSKATSELEIGFSDFDAWLLYYPPGTEIPRHLDPAPPGKRHKRLNAVVVGDSGGNLLLERMHTTKEVVVPEGSAVIFSPSETRHAVSRVKNQRLILSIGAFVDE